MENNIYSLVFKVTHAGGSGSCFYLKSCDLFVTNYHVVEGFHSVAIHDANRNPYLARVVLVNAALDIALLAVDNLIHEIVFQPFLIAPLTHDESADIDPGKNRVQQPFPVLIVPYIPTLICGIQVNTGQQMLHYQNFHGNIYVMELAVRQVRKRGRPILQRSERIPRPKFTPVVADLNQITKAVVQDFADCTVAHLSHADGLTNQESVRRLAGAKSLLQALFILAVVFTQVFCRFRLFAHISPSFFQVSNSILTSHFTTPWS